MTNSYKICCDLVDQVDVAKDSYFFEGRGTDWSNLVLSQLKSISLIRGDRIRATKQSALSFGIQKALMDLLIWGYPNLL